jgi:hypothetical protein
LFSSEQISRTQLILEVISVFEVSNKELNKIKQKYIDYIQLYKFCNGGSDEGVTDFEQFYWRMSHLIKYDDPKALWQSGY